MSKLRLLLLGFVLFSAQILSAQTREVTGKVTDAGGAPMSNVSVTAKGSRNGTATGNDGTFTLTVDANAKALIVSAIGFETQEIAITGAPLSISLKAGRLWYQN